MREIPLTQGKVALVDDEDFEWLSQYKWHFTMGYVAHRFGYRGPIVLMHRMILKPPRDMDIDHRDGDGLNNQKSNIRICTTQQNLRNTKKRHGTSSIYKGVNFHRQRGKWAACIHLDGKGIYLGLFVTEKEAALAYNKAASELFGEFAKLNEIDDDR